MPICPFVRSLIAAVVISSAALAQEIEERVSDH
jgi:hypothetical protein